jgi:predicted NBD/HSP70 family sugar kinase
MSNFLALDIGGSFLKISEIRSSDKFSFYKIKTPSSYGNFLKFLRSFNKTYEKIIIGFPGVVVKGKIFCAPNLTSWENNNLLNDVKKIFDSDVIILNDVALEGLGEAIFGQGKNYGIVAYFAFGTGIGGVKIVDKKIDKVLYGFEPGHQIILLDKIPIEWEWLAGGAHLERIFGESAEKIKGRAKWKTIENFIVLGLYNALLFWSPEIFILGGSLIRNKNISLKRIRKNLEKLNYLFPQIPKIKLSKLKEKAFIYGAKSIIFNQ